MTTGEALQSLSGIENVIVRTEQKELQETMHVNQEYVNHVMHDLMTGSADHIESPKAALVTTKELPGHGFQKTEILIQQATARKNGTVNQRVNFTEIVENLLLMEEVSKRN